jgi:tripartite-type tricarboxylate transporter receptor subunit TctC
MDAFRPGRLAFFSALILPFLFVFSVEGAEFPKRPVNLIVPWGAGSATDMVARALASGARKGLGEPVIVENKVGGAGVVGAQYVLSKPSDGYTMGIHSLNPFLIAHISGSMNQHPGDDFTHILRVCGYLFAIAVRDDAPWKNIQQFIEYARANPGKISYSSSGVGTTGHINMEEFALLAKIQLTHIPYKSGNESNTALLGGHVDALSDAAWAPLAASGKFRVLLIFAGERVPRYPQVPIPREVVSENVRPGYLLLFAGKGIPRPALKKLHDSFKAAMNEPEYINVLDKFNLTPLYLNSDDCEKAVRDDMEPIRKLVQKLGLGKK